MYTYVPTYVPTCSRSGNVVSRTHRHLPPERSRSHISSDFFCTSRIPMCLLHPLFGLLIEMMRHTCLHLLYAHIRMRFIPTFSLRSNTCFGILTLCRRQNGLPLPNLPFFLLSIFFLLTVYGVPSELRAGFSFSSSRSSFLLPLPGAARVSTGS